jgi:D-glycero-D-manno-heptose 1,7-bisphosphate phosphatase
VGIDRDGVLTDCKDGKYINTWQEVHFLPKSINAIVKLQSYGLVPVLITNQAGIAHGFTSWIEYSKINHKIQQAIISQGGNPIEIFTCHHGHIESCGCRKPEAGLLYKAEGKLSPLTMGWMIGDYWTDIVAGKKKGCHTILVGTGRGLNPDNINYFEANPHNIYDNMANDLSDAVDIVVNQFVLHSCRRWENEMDKYKGAIIV